MNNTKEHLMLSSNGKGYRELQDIYLKWHDQHRPTSGFIDELLAWHERLAQEIEANVLEKFHICYHCKGRTSLIKYGCYPNGRQRYICKDCNQPRHETNETKESA